MQEFPISLWGDYCTEVLSSEGQVQAGSLGES